MQTLQERGGGRRVDFVAELGTSFDGVLCGLAGCGRNFKCRVFRAWSRGARPPSGAVGCASRPTCRRSHRPAAAFFQFSPQGRVFPPGNLFVCGADCPHGSGVPLLQPRGSAGGDDRSRSSGAGLLRRSRVESVATWNAFRRRLVWPPGCGRNFECRAFRVGRAHSISRRVRMSEFGLRRRDCRRNGCRTFF
jgi:hypothetical protein